MSKNDLLYLQVASEAFCTDPLPDEWESMSEEEQDEWFSENKTSKFEYVDNNNLYSLISDHADSIKETLSKISEHSVAVELNQFDETGSVVDSSTKELTLSNVTDIIDSAAQLITVLRDMVKISDFDDIDHVYAELEAALEVAGVISEKTRSIPTQSLC